MSTAKAKPLVIFGSAEIATLARYYFEQDGRRKVIAYTVDDAYMDKESLDGLPIVPWSRVAERHPPSDFEMHVALSYKKLNRLRQEKYEQAKAAGYSLASYVCSKSAIWPDLAIGDNCFVLENQTIQPTVTIGNNVMLWSGNHIGHGTVIGDHSYVASHVVISGHCKIGKRCFLGVNATLKDFTTVGDECFVAMAAAVTRDVNDGAVVVGTSGEIYPADDRRAQVLKKKFFGL